MPETKSPIDVPPALLELKKCDSFSVSSAVPSMISSNKKDDTESLGSENEIVDHVERTKAVILITEKDNADFPGSLNEIEEVEKTEAATLTTKKDHTDSLGSENEIVEEVETTKAASFTVQGIYTKWYPTPEEIATKDREFVCCRRRLQTRPLSKEESGEDESNNELDGNKDGGDSMIESRKNDGKSKCENEREEEDDYETAMFVPEIGLVGGNFWHEYDGEATVVREDRAVLFQSQENYERLCSHKRYKTCFEDINYMEHPTFGEQVIVNGIDVSDLAIGDVFEIKGGLSPLVVEITAPRKPCNYMNQKHGTSFGGKGIRHYTHKRILAGWFARVLIAGELREGMEFIRKAHPNPKWTLTYIHKALYGEGNDLESKKNVSSWNRDREELEELIALPQLGECEWKVEGRRRLYKFDGIDWKTVRNDLIDPQTKVQSFFHRFNPFG